MQTRKAILHKKIVSPKQAKHFQKLCGTFFRTLVLAIATTHLLFHATLTNAAGIDLLQDGDGWTVFTPSPETRIMYVATNGNDTTGQVYNSTSSEIGSNPFQPSGPINPFATYAAAYANSRNGYPDWILFKRGDTFYQNIYSSIRNGKSPYEPFVIGSYGLNGNTPILKVGANSALRIARTSPSTPSTAQNIAIFGIDFVAHTRVPESAEYIDTSGNSGISIISYDTGNKIQNILIEGCKFRYFTNNTIEGAGTESIDNFFIRRSLFLSNYAISGHSQGIYANNVNNLILEENIFDHNGWHTVYGEDGIGVGTIFNHNTYFNSAMNTKFKGNIFCRPSNMQNKFTSSNKTDNLSIEGNLYIDGHIGVGIGTNYLTNNDRFTNILIQNNIITNTGRTNVTGQGIAWGIQVSGWHGGEIKNNYLINQTEDIAGSAFAIELWNNNENIKIFDNIIYDFQGGSVFITNNTVDNISIENNTIQLPQGGSSIILVNNTINGYSFSSNKYYSIDKNIFEFEKNKNSFNEWILFSGDSSTLSNIKFKDPDRSIDKYMETIGEPKTIDAFISKCRELDRYNWDTKFTANQVISWIKDGYAEATPVLMPADFQLKN